MSEPVNRDVIEEGAPYATFARTVPARKRFKDVLFIVSVVGFVVDTAWAINSLVLGFSREESDIIKSHIQLSISCYLLSNSFIYMVKRAWCLLNKPEYIDKNKWFDKVEFRHKFKPLIDKWGWCWTVPIALELTGTILGAFFWYHSSGSACVWSECAFYGCFWLFNWTVREIAAIIGIPFSFHGIRDFY